MITKFSSRLKHIALVLMLGLGFAGAGRAQSAAGTVSGTVTYAANGNALHDVALTLTQLKRTAQSDETGKFQFANVPPGIYTILAHLEGFPDKAQQVTVTAGGAATLDFALQLTGVREQVTVTAGGTEESTLDVIQAVSTVDSTSLVERSTVSLGEAMDNQPGVNKRSSGAGSSRPVIRGFDGDRVLVSTDGVRVGSLASQSGDHAEPVDTLAVERIEVVKGPGTLLYGSNAIGGVVNAISGHDEGAHPGTRGYFSAIGGANNRQGSGSGGVEYGTQRWLFWGNGSAQRTGDYTAGGAFGAVRNTFTRNGAGQGGFGYFAGKAFANFNYSYDRNRYGIPFDPGEPDDLRTLRQRRHNARFNGGYRDADNFLTSFKFTLDYSNYRHQELNNDIVGTTFNNRVTSYRGMFDQKRAGRLTGRFGFDGFSRSYATIGEESLVRVPVRQKAFSVFGLEDLRYERVTLQFGGRLENNRYRPADDSLPQRSYTNLSGAAGARFSLWQGGVFAANFSRSLRAPALEELYNNGPHDGSLSFEIGNANLKTERSNGLDLSLRQQSRRLRAEANFYYYDLKNYVFLAPTGTEDADSGFPIARFLQGDSRYTGTEINLDVTANQHLNLLAGMDYVNAQLNTGQPLPRIPPLRVRLGLDARAKGFSFRPELLLVKSQNRVFSNETRTAGYGVVNVIASYIRPGQHHAQVFSVNAFNLTDKLFFNHLSFIKDISPEIGRGVRFSYTVRFF